MEKFQVVRVQGAPISDADYIEDLKRVSELAGTSKVTQAIYAEKGRYDRRNLSRRFGTWNKALTAAGLSISNEIGISDERLFENILLLWQHYGRQPRKAELARTPSKISQGAYRRRFKSWMEALHSFADWANTSDDVRGKNASSEALRSEKKNGRGASLRLRFKVMLRDRFTCQSCGASPAKRLGVELHIDHIAPWSKGGETVFENLQTLCSDCNLGKGNISQTSGSTSA